MRRESRDLASEAAKDARALIPRKTPRADMGLAFHPSEDEDADRLEAHFDRGWRESANRADAAPTFCKASNPRVGGKPSSY